MTNDCKTCPVSTGTHKPAEALHQQIDEPQSEALRLAAWLLHRGMSGIKQNDIEASNQLRWLHAESLQHKQELAAYRFTVANREARIAELEADLEAVGAGGVQSLRKQAAAPQAVQPVLGWIHKLRNGKIGSKFYTYEPHCDCAVRDDGGEKIPVVAAPAHPAEGVPAQEVTYAEARECEHCNHVGINDAADGMASCTACQWNGDSPKEDKCPDCEAEGTMTASCPKCHHEYRLIADATLAATHPTQQGIDAFRALYDSVVHSIDEGLLTGKALEAIILVPAVDFFESAKQTYTKEPQSELELNSARWKHVTNEAGTGMVSLVRFASNGSPCALIGSEANSFVDAAIAAQAKQGGASHG